MAIPYIFLAILLGFLLFLEKITKQSFTTALGMLLLLWFITIVL